MKPIVIKLSILAVLLIAAANAQSIALGGATIVDLPDALPLGGQISQSFARGNTAALPQLGKDYILQDTRYFDNGEWVVTGIKALNDTITDGIVTLRKDAGTYTIALGPGTAFPSTQVYALPTDVAAYLSGIGAIYDPL